MVVLGELMFSKIRHFFVRRHLNGSFSKYLHQDGVDAMLNGELNHYEMSSRQVCFVLIELNPDSGNNPQLMMPLLVDTVVANQGVIDTMVSHLVVASFGVHDFSSIAAHRACIDAIRAKFGRQVRITYASGVAQVGNIGSDKMISYSYIHPLFPDALAALSSISYGEAHEIGN